MIIISWDVGVIHLAYCVLKYTFNGNNRPEVKILDWDVINLIEDVTIKLECCGKIKKDKISKISKICGKNATYYLDVGKSGKNIGFCKTHLAQYADYWPKTKTEMLFRKSTTTNSCGCTYVKMNSEKCNKSSKYSFKYNGDKQYYCGAHYRSELKKKIKEFSPQPIKNLIVKKYPTSQLQLTLINRLDKLAEHFGKLHVEEVVIENQPTHKNPKMKSISNTLFDYFLIRGYIDKFKGLDIGHVRFMCPSNKLKVNNDNTIQVFRSNKDSKEKYKLTKALSIQYTKQLIDSDKKQLEYLDLYTKQDDICDAYLQGRYYLEFIKNKKTQPKTSSKTKKKRKIISI